MAARTRRIFNDANTRAKIQTTQLVKRLTDHIFDRVDLTATQVRGIEVLLKKTLPDLNATQLEAGESLQTVLFDIVGRDRKD